MPASPEILVCQPGQSWLDHACRLFRDVTDQAIRSRGSCIIALSGGSTPKALYGALTSVEWRSQCQWDRMIFLFGDERGVPPDHPDSNYGLAQEALFSPLGIGVSQVHRMKGESADLSLAAAEYERTVRTLTHSPAPAVPRLDLILLGMGEDGHTASLFPGTPALSEQERLVAVGVSPKGIPSRLTLTLGVINRATVVLFLVTGAGKAQTVRAIIQPQTQAERALPAAQVKPDGGRLVWLLDDAAAAALRQ
ncbi:MAG: 6-phosphogluconolactonase [Nitrospira sp.]|nr:6-phosphogluconolactonase [Nitrospira sp.]